GQGLLGIGEDRHFGPCAVLLHIGRVEARIIVARPGEVDRLIVRPCTAPCDWQHCEAPPGGCECLRELTSRHPAGHDPVTQFCSFHSTPPSDSSLKKTVWGDFRYALYPRVYGR